MKKFETKLKKFQNSADVEMDIFARFLIAALQTGCNIIPVVAPGFKWPRPDTLPEDVSPICHMNGIKWKFGLQVISGETIKIR